MFRFIRISLFTLALLAIATMGALPVHAQTMRTIEIQGGKVYVDGQLLEASELPDSLDLTGIVARFQFVGDVSPVFEMGDRLIRLDGRKLIPVVGQPAFAAPQAFQMQGAQMMDAAQRFDQMARQYQLQEQQQYLREIQRRDTELYQLLIREAQADQETLVLAGRIRVSQDEAEKDRLRSELQKKLEYAFELKQDARRREIRQLEEQLKDLQQMLQVRENARSRIIERRMQDLLTPQQ